MRLGWPLCTMLAVAAFAAAGGLARAETASGPAGPVAGDAVTWDRPDNIRQAAERIGVIQRTRGAEAAMKHIDACYRTHGLATAYSAAYEGCIAQDYMQTKLLTRVYSRMAPDHLRKIGAPTADDLAQAMGRRLVAAFSKYKVSTGAAEAVKAEVDKTGMPVFLKAVFPNAAAEIDALGGKFNDPDKSKEKN